MAIKEGDVVNFKTLLGAAGNNALALMECRDPLGDYVAVICAVNFNGKEYIFTPLAKLFEGNPYKEVSPNLPEPNTIILQGEELCLHEER